VQREPHVCQALKSLATHETDRNDARGLGRNDCPGAIALDQTSLSCMTNSNI
jgi:hypothetical protein